MGKCLMGICRHGYMSHGYMSPNPISRFASEARRKLSLKRLSSRGASSPNQSGIESLVLNEVADADTPSREGDTQGQASSLGLEEENSSSVQRISFPDDSPRM